MQGVGFDSRKTQKDFFLLENFLPLHLFGSIPIRSSKLCLLSGSIPGPVEIP
jgi:hypothetical protein